MKLSYRLYIYAGFYFEILSSNTHLSDPKWKLWTKSWENEKNGEHEKIAIYMNRSINLHTLTRNIYFQGYLDKHSVLWAELPMNSFHFTQKKIILSIHG